MKITGIPKKAGCINPKPKARDEILALSPTFYLSALDNATADAGYITSFADKSGNTNHFSQGTEANQPVMATKGMFGKKGLLFSSTKALVKTGDIVGNGNITFCMVFREYSYTAGTTRLFDNNKFKVFHGSAGHFSVQSDGSTSAVSADQVYKYGQLQVLTITRTSAGVTNIYLNGVLTGTADQSSGTPAAGSNTYIGNNSGLAAGMNAHIGDVVLYRKILTTAERQRVESALTRKYTNKPRLVTVATHHNLLGAQGLSAVSDVGAPMSPVLDTTGKIIFDTNGLCDFVYQNGNPFTMRVAKFEPLTGVFSDDRPITNDSTITSGISWASPHIVMKLSDTRYVMFYSEAITARKIKAATATALTGSWTAVSGFEIAPSDSYAWEGTSSGYLEVDCGLRIVSETSTTIDMYILYSAQGASSSFSQGWARVSVTKATGAVTYTERYASNPLDNLKPSGISQFRDGGSLPYTLNGYYCYWGWAVLSTDPKNTLILKCSTDPMFESDTGYIVHNVDDYYQPTAYKNCEKPYFFPLPDNSGRWALYWQNDTPNGGTTEPSWTMDGKIFQIA